MESDDVLRKQLSDLLHGGNAHAPFERVVADFPVEAYNRPVPGGTYTPWHLLEHLRIAQWDILEFIRDPKHVSPPWPAGYWPAKDVLTDEAQWKRTIAQFEADLQDLEDLVVNPATRLTAEIPHAPGYNILREILVVSDHNAFHLGEFSILRQAMGTWPANHRE
jgi:hypothetical protein